MKKIRIIAISLVALVLFTTTICSAQSKNKVRKIEYNSAYNYEVATVAVGVDGTKLIKVWGYGKTVEDAIRKAKQNAVACAITRGFPAGAGGRAAKTPAIVANDDIFVKHDAYFTAFFDIGGKYLQYVNLSTDAPPSGADRIKVNKKSYKVGVTISIAFDELRKEMEKQGIARSLDSGF